MIDTKNIQLIICIFQIKQNNLTAVTERIRKKNKPIWFGTLQVSHLLATVLILSRVPSYC